MSNQIEFFDVPGLAKCFTIERKTDHYFWNTNTQAFEESVSDEYAAINLTEGSGTGKGTYLEIFPAAITTAGDYIIRCWDTSAAEFDSDLGYSGGYIFTLDGEEELTIFSLWEKIEDIWLTDSGEFD